jgi:hypothetical protein
MTTKFIIFLVLSVTFLIPSTGHSEALEESAAELLKGTKPRLYESAAKARRNAADIQAETASKLLEQAADRKAMDALTEVEKVNHYCAAGDLEIKAGDTRVLAAKNYQMSVSNVLFAISSYVKLPKDQLENLQKQIATDRYNTETYFQKAIMAYLTAADSFSWNRGNHGEKEAVTHERIAIILEKYAPERPREK